MYLKKKKERNQGMPLQKKSIKEGSKRRKGGQNNYKIYRKHF